MEKKNKKGALRFFCLTLAVVLLSSIFIWGFQTNWGQVEIKRQTMTNADGTALSTLIYIPETATVENPAPCAIIYHGRSNQGHSNDTWCMELARRGYVVLSPDLSGGGESYTYSGGYFDGGRTMQGVACVEYALNLDIVNPEQINLIGYSLGTATVTMVAAEVPDKINSCLDVFGPFMIRRYMDTVKSIMVDHDIDTGIIKADCDQYDFNFLGDAVACRESVTKSLGLPEVIQANSVTPWARPVCCTMLRSPAPCTRPVTSAALPSLRSSILKTPSMKPL